MQRVRPVRMSATETAAVWVRWRRGGSISEIGRAMDRSPGSIFYQLATHGGISPVPRTRSWVLPPSIVATPPLSRSNQTA